MYEYVEDVPDTWKYYAPPEKPRGFDEALAQIGGLNRHGKPNLRVVWGGSEMSDRAHHSQLKYSAGFKESHHGWVYKDENGESVWTDNFDDLDPSIMVYPQIREEELGLPRWVIEAWTSPEQLEKAKRFRTTHDSIGQVLRDFPREGVYDCYFIVQRANGLFRNLDDDVLHFIKAKWHFDGLTDAEQDAILEAQEQAKFDEITKRKDELVRAAASFDIRLDPEERERREHYWATKDDYEAEAMRVAMSSQFYQHGA